MTIIKRLTSIGLVGALTLGTAGCNTQDEYEGKIGKDQVNLREYSYSLTPNRHILNVEKSDGRKIEYLDLLKNDLKLDEVRITVNGNTEYYTARDEVGKTVLEKAQRQFDECLKKIDEINAQEREERNKERINQALEGLR